MKNQKPSIIGIDRDGVINEDLWTYCYRIEDFKLIPNSDRAIQILKNIGFKIAIITNQGGIEKGLYTENDVELLHQHMCSLIGKENIDSIYFSTSTRQDDLRAKPNIGMFKQAEEELKIKFSDGYFVGDKLSDLQAAISIGAIPVLVRTGYGEKTEQELEKHPEIKKRVFIFNTLFDFAVYMQD